MPQLCLELHQWRAEGIFIWDLDVYLVCPAFIWCIWWTMELPPQVCKVIVLDGVHQYLGVGVCLDIGNLFCNSPCSVGGHYAKMCGNWYLLDWMRTG